MTQYVVSLIEQSHLVSKEQKYQSANGALYGKSLLPYRLFSEACNERDFKTTHNWEQRNVFSLPVPTW